MVLKYIGKFIKSLVGGTMVEGVQDEFNTYSIKIETDKGEWENICKNVENIFKNLDLVDVGEYDKVRGVAHNVYLDRGLKTGNSNIRTKNIRMSDHNPLINDSGVIGFLCGDLFQESLLESLLVNFSKDLWYLSGVTLVVPCSFNVELLGTIIS